MPAMLTLAFSIAFLAASAASADQVAASGGGKPPGDKPAEAKPAELDLGQKKPSPATVLEEVTGTVVSVDRQTRHVELTTAKGPVSLGLDRNTLVYTQGGLGSVLDIAPGQPIRAGRNAVSVAYWVQIRPAGNARTPSTPAQAAGPSGGAGPSTPDTTGSGATPPSGPATPAGPTAPGGSTPPGK